MFKKTAERRFSIVSGAGRVTIPKDVRIELKDGYIPVIGNDCFVFCSGVSSAVVKVAVNTNEFCEKQRVIPWLLNATQRKIVDNGNNFPAIHIPLFRSGEKVFFKCDEENNELELYS